MKKTFMTGGLAGTLFFLISFSRVFAQTMAAVTVTTNSLGIQIPSNFVGISMEWQYAQDYFGTTAAPNNTLFQLMKNLGSGVYRIGGNSTDEWCWDSGPSECQHQLTSGMINSIFNASAKTGFGVIAGVNLTDSSTANAVDTVTAFVNEGLKAYPGSTLIGAEIGNEPDLFDTSTNTDDQDYPSSYTIEDNESDYKNFVTALNNNATTKGIPWVGPAFAGGWSSQLGSWISAVRTDGVGSTLPNPALLTIHNYPLSACGGGTGTISELLSASSMTSHIATYGGYEQTAAGYGYKLRVAETNSAACGGLAGVSDVEAAALWGMDDMFEYAQAGIVGVNFHGGGTSTSNGEDYSAIFTTGSNGEGTSSQGATVAPLYYSLLMFANAQGKYMLPVTVSSSDNITAYAVAASASADPQVFVINKDTAASGLVSIQPSESMTSATLLVQSGTSLSDSNPTYGGVRPSTSTGVLPAPNTTTLSPTAGGAFQFNLANASAAMITLHRGPTPTPVVLSTWRVVAGGPAHTDCNNNVWAADENYVGGTGATSTNTIAGALPCTSDAALYQDQRYGASFSYVFNVPAGSYQVTLKFAETYFTAAGDREFNVSINGTTELTNFDIFAAAGGENIAIDKVYNNIAPSGGAITITFGPSAVNNAVVDSIQIIPQPATATVTATFSKTATSTFTSSPTSTPTLTLTSTNTLSATATKTNSNTPTSTYTSSYTPTLTLTSAPSNTPTKTDTSTAVNTASATSTASFSPTGTSPSSPTAIVTSTNTGTPTPTNRSAVPTSTKTYTFTPSATATNTSTSTNTATSSPTGTSTSSLTASPTLTYSFTFTKTASPTATMTNTNTNTPTVKIPTATNTFTVTATFTPTEVPPTSTATTSLCAGVANWSGNFVYYAIGAKVVYDGELYQCIQAHTSQSTWEPNVVPALWKTLGACGVATSIPALAVAQPVVYPNPVTSSTTSIQLPVNDATNVKVQVFTVAMRQVQTIIVPQVFGNTLTVQLMDKSGISLADGLYYFVIQANGQKWTDKVLILR